MTAGFGNEAGAGLGTSLTGAGDACLRRRAAGFIAGRGRSPDAGLTAEAQSCSFYRRTRPVTRRGDALPERRRAAGFITGRGRSPGAGTHCLRRRAAGFITGRGRSPGAGFTSEAQSCSFYRRTRPITLHGDSCLRPRAAGAIAERKNENGKAGRWPVVRRSWGRVLSFPPLHGRGLLMIDR